MQHNLGEGALSVRLTEQPGARMMSNKNDRSYVYSLIQCQPLAIVLHVIGLALPLRSSSYL